MNPTLFLDTALAFLRYVGTIVTLGIPLMVKSQRDRALMGSLSTGLADIASLVHKARQAGSPGGESLTKAEVEVILETAEALVGKMRSGLRSRVGPMSNG